MSEIAIIGGGAAGFFAAISAKEHHPSADVTIYEKSGKLLSKVRVSGGGRCNVTHACFDISELVRFYPRGSKELRGAFHQFNTNDTVRWFEQRGVKLKTEADGRIFPVSDSSQTIIDCLTGEAERLGVNIKLNSSIELIKREESKLVLSFATGEKRVDAIIVAAGGSPFRKGFDWLQASGHTIVDPVPSLFTFNVPDKELNKLMGVSTAKARVQIKEIKMEATGPVLITHWGFSGPAVLKLSSFAARELAGLNYNFNVTISWIIVGEDELRTELNDLKRYSGSKLILNAVPPELTKRLWEYLLLRSRINPQTRCADLSSAAINQLVNVLLYDKYSARGKTTFKEEFVTCGGISLKEVDFKTMQSKKWPGLFFAGEILDIDGVTGGFNFQAAWTTGYIAGKSALGSE